MAVVLFRDLILEHGCYTSNTSALSCYYHSMAILKYLARKYHVADHWYPEDLKVRAKIDQYLDWQHTGVRKVNIECLMVRSPPSLHPTSNIKLVLYVI